MINIEMNVNGAKLFTAIVFLFQALCFGADKSALDLSLIESFLKSGKTSKAKDEVAKFLSKNDSAAAYEKTGTLFARLKQWSEAVHYLEIARSREPENSLILYKLGIAYHQNKNANEAIDAFRKSLSINPKSLSTALALGDVLEYADDNYDAREVYREALKKIGENSELRAKLCSLDYQDGFWSDAIKNCSISVTKDPKNEKSWALLAVSYYETQNREKSILEFKKGFSIHSKSALLYRARGLIYFRENSFEQAVHDLGIAAGLDALDDEAMIFLARSFYSLNKYEEAKIAYTEATKLDRSYKFEFQSKQKDLVKKNLLKFATAYEEVLSKM